MTDYIAKARSNRLAALERCTMGSEMFFPKDDTVEKAEADMSRRRHKISCPKPIFFRSSEACAMAANGHAGNVSQKELALFVLTQEYSVAA